MCFLPFDPPLLRVCGSPLAGRWPAPTLRHLGLDHEAGSGCFANLPHLTINTQNDRSGGGDELEHLSGNDGLEDVGLRRADFSAVRHAHGANVADKELCFGVEFLPHGL
jgi:hypothetical protein